MYTGMIKYWNSMKQFGFMTRDDGEPDIFIGSHALNSAGLPYPRPGDRLDFEIELDQQGRPHAVKVQPLGVPRQPADPAQPWEPWR